MASNIEEMSDAEIAAYVQRRRRNNQKIQLEQFSAHLDDALEPLRTGLLDEFRFSTAKGGDDDRSIFSILNDLRSDVDKAVTDLGDVS